MSKGTVGAVIDSCGSVLARDGCSRHGRSRASALLQQLVVLCVVVMLSACGGSHNSRPSSSKRGSSGGGSGRVSDDISRSQSSRYRSNSDSVPTDIPDVSKIPEPVPKAEPRSLYGNKSPYSVLGQTYNVLPSPKGYVERGIASFYGNKFHGYKTSNLEEYDMYQFSAAHKTLPLPSYARVTNLQNGKSVIVRINDRGPFHENRIIDLSFAAAVKIGVWPSGTGLVEVRAIDPNDPSSVAAPPFVQTSPKPAPNSSTSTPVAVGNPEDAGPVPGMTDASVRDALPPGAGGQGGRSVVLSDGEVGGVGRKLPPTTAERAPSAAISAPVGTTIPVARAQPAASEPAPATASVPGKPSIYLQVGAFSDLANANRVAEQLNRAGLGPVSVIETSIGGRNVRRVRVGPLADVDTADRVTDQIAGMGLPKPQVAVD